MAKKLILLLLIIPIVVMILLFAATQTLSNLVEVPVTGIEIIGTDEFVYLDVDKEETYTIEYAVYPTTAKNKNVSVSTEAFGDEPLAEFDFDIQEGNVTVIPKSAGAARVVLTTVNGGFRDSIVVYADSTKLQAIESTITNSELLVGETAKINTTFLPENPSNTLLEYVSSNPAVVQVTPNGVVRALSKGTATITVTSEFDRSISDTVTVTVSNKDEMDLGTGSMSSFFGKGSIPVSIKSDSMIALSNLSYQIFDAEGNLVPASVVTAQFKIDGTSVTLDYEFVDDSFVGTVVIEITFVHNDITITKSCSVSKMREIEIAFDVDGVFSITAGTIGFIPYILTPEDAEATYSAAASNGNATVYMDNNNKLVITPVKAGTVEITLTATNVAYPEQVKTATVTVVITPKNMTVTEAAREFGIEKTFTIGGFEFDATGNLIPSALGSNAFTLHFQTSTEAGEGFYENIHWHSSSDEVLIDENGVISFANNTFVGEVSFWPTFYTTEVEEGKIPDGAYTIRCVANGINVYSYADLYNATQKVEHQIVLQKDITEDFGYINGEYKELYTEMHTTYDDTYYQNTNTQDAAKVKILLQFRNDLYGNGHVINAHNVTYKLHKEVDDKGNIIRTQPETALFQGPLDFVKITQDNDATISVKAQDNICFAVYENVTLNNVELRGCDLESDEDGNQDLVDLDYIGTTVEVLGDNVTIEFSRITNGRTVLRVFGDETDSVQEINLFITNSVLSGAREFIMRVGSNRFIDGVDDYISPNLPGDVKGEYNSKKEYHNFTEEQKKAYDEKYINTYVTVRNSVFKDTAIFAIGMDSHFAGVLLHDGPTAVSGFGETAMGYVKDWYNIAKTSYGAKLRFEGDVELYNWKDLDDVDSSTLIEIKGSVSGTFKDMQLDLKEMVEKASEEEVYKNIITPYNGKNYVHAGIAFFGGGKNYSVFDSEEEISLGRYEVSLDIVNKAILKIAAGDEDFYFFIYDKTSPTSSPEKQETKLADKSAYECIYRK